MGRRHAAAHATNTMFGAFEAGSASQFVATVPEIAWEASLGIYLIAKGFKPCSHLFDQTCRTEVDEGSVALAMAAR